MLKGLSIADGLAALRRAAQLPLEVSGLAFLPRGALALSSAARQTGLAHAKTATLIRVDGAAETVADKVEHLKREFAGRDAAVLDGEATQTLFAEIGNGALFAGSDSDLWRLCVPSSDAAAAADAAGAALWFADWAGGVLWLELPASFEIATRLRAITARHSGHALLMRRPRRSAHASRGVRTRTAGARASDGPGQGSVRSETRAQPRPHVRGRLMRTAFTETQLAGLGVRAVEQELRKCVHCGFCTAVCPTYLVLGDERDSPRGRMALIQNMLESDAAPTAETVEHLDRCLSCLGCRTICPSTVDYATLIDTAREHIETHFQRPWRDRTFRSLVLFVMTRPRVFALALALGRMAKPLAALLPGRLREMAAKVPKRNRLSAAHRAAPAPAHAKERVALLPGCVQRALAPEIDLAARRVLARQGIDAVPLAQTGCCGALAWHMGKTEIGKAQARALIETCEGAGSFDAVLNTVTGCTAFLKDYGHVFADDPEWRERASAFAKRMRDFSELAEPAAGVKTPSLRVAYHPPCSLQFGQRIAGKGEALLQAAGFTLAPFADAHLCCGSAGSYSLLQPAMSAELRARKLIAIAAAAPDAIVTGNIGCLTQLAGPIPIVHLAELLDWAVGGPKPPGIG